jgi:outer membrane protein OmpA-like peptidoglycan-associated protein
MNTLTYTASHFSTILKKRFFLFLFSGCFTVNAQAQNLFANAGFEDLNVCTEYHASCAPEAWYYIKPTNNPLVSGRVAPKALLGTNVLLVPVANVYTPYDQRSYVYTKLTCPLEKGKQYKLSFYLNSSKRSFYNIDFYFSEKEPATYGFTSNGLNPSFSITPYFIEAEMKQGWQAVVYTFTATETASFCLIGNMSKEILPYKEADKMSSSGNIYYFLDEIKLTPILTQLPCASYQENINKMYAQNYRHTDFTIVDTEEKKPAKPVFVIDKITVPAAFFETGKAFLKPAFQKLMDSLTLALPLKKVAKMEITGYTDNKGLLENNLSLSIARAEAVKNYILQKMPQYNDIIFISGKGQENPIAENNTEAGRSKNRRVEIILTCSKIIQ